MADADHYLKLYIGEAVIAAARAQGASDALKKRLVELQGENAGLLTQLAQLQPAAPPPPAGTPETPETPETRS